MRQVKAQRAIFSLLTLGVAAVCAHPVLAGLGDTEASVQADSVRMKAALRRVVASGYTLHELLLPTGTTVREFLDANGTVFAVSWQGPFKPDLQQLLGRYFATFVAAPRSAGSTRSRMSINTGALVMSSSGHMRAFAGFAYVPQLLPTGVDPRTLP